MPILQATECALLVIETVPFGPANRTVVETYRLNAELLKRAARIVQVPTFQARFRPDLAQDERETQELGWHGFDPAGGTWQTSPLGVAVGNTGRPCLIITGYWLEAGVTFAALHTLGDGYDTYITLDITPPEDRSESVKAQQRLFQSGVVPTTLKQVIQEWAAHTLDLGQRNALLSLLNH